MVINYWALSKLLVEDLFLLPHPEDIMAKLQRMKQFSKLDLFTVYHQHYNHPDSIKKTAFSGPDALYKCVVMPFGVTNAPSKFMRLMIDLLWEHIDDNYCIVCIDGILMYSKDNEEHSRQVKAVLETIRKPGFRLQEAKCTIGKTKAPLL
jgi:hypothetical protein